MTFTLNNAGHLLAGAIALAVLIVITVQLVRALPPVNGWTLQGKKPWACNLCMSTWTGWAWGVALYGLRGLVVGLAGAGGAWLLLHWYETQQPKGGPPPSMDWL